MKTRQFQLLTSLLIIFGITGVYVMKTLTAKPLPKRSGGLILHVVNTREDIPTQLQDTPIGKLLTFHNISKSEEKFDKAELLIGTCMDNRISLQLPERFAYVIRRAGANMRDSEFPISYGLSTGITYFALIGHTDCGMVGLASQESAVVQGYAKHLQWEQEKAVHYFKKKILRYEITDEIKFTNTEAQRLAKLFPTAIIVPMIYKVEDNKLYLIQR